MMASELKAAPRLASASILVVNVVVANVVTGLAGTANVSFLCCQTVVPRTAIAQLRSTPKENNIIIVRIMSCIIDCEQGILTDSLWLADRLSKDEKAPKLKKAKISC
jgi:hypothetical protein